MKKLLILPTLVVSVLLLASGCVTPESATNSKPGDNTTAGTVMGGLIGASAGMELSSDGDRNKGAIIGAIVGAGAGNMIGRADGLRLNCAIEIFASFTEKNSMFGMNLRHVPNFINFM